MRVIGIFVFLSLLWPSFAQATVYEFNADGTVLKHESHDYRSQQGARKYDVLLPAIVKESRLYSAESDGYEAFIQRASVKYGISADLIRAVIKQESAGKRDAVSPKGAGGLMQLMPDTARQYGITDLFDPAQNIDAGTRHLGYLSRLYEGDLNLILAAYNAGEGTVDKYKGVPPYSETVSYIRKIKKSLNSSINAGFYAF